jgi:glutamyl-tRNA synthetase
LIRGRLAPSPTGYLHLGNARSFMLAWLQARAAGGEVILRIEDLDQARAAPGAAEAIVRDLEWLGLDWDNPLAPEHFQSNRLELYRDALEELRQRGLVYECFCSRRELRGIASAPHGSTGPAYPGTCRDLTAEERDRRREDKEPALRFRVPPGAVIEFTDLVAGPQREALDETVGDFILARADGIPGYQLAVVLDDIAMGITHVLRGDDLLSSTGRQILLFHTFGAEPPLYAHVPLILGPDGTRLAKRHGSVSLAELRDAGHDPRAVTGWLAWTSGLLPESHPVRPTDLLPTFSLEAITREPTHMQTADLPTRSI